MFLFSLAAEQKKFVAEIEQTMGADEFVEWIAYYQLRDDAYKAKIESDIAQERSDREKNRILKDFLSTFVRKKCGK